MLDKPERRKRLKFEDSVESDIPIDEKTISTLQEDPIDIEAELEM